MRRRTSAAIASHKKHRKLWVWLLALIVLATVACGTGVLVHVSQVHKTEAVAAAVAENTRKERAKWKHSVLQRTYDQCVGATMQDDGTNNDDLTLADGDATLTLRSPDTPLNTYETYKCVAKWTEMPEAIQAKIGQTNGFSGMQSDLWGNLEATWSYNGDSGLTLILERQ